MTPETPQTLAHSGLRRSSRRRALLEDPTTPEKTFSSIEKPFKDSPKSSNLAKNGAGLTQRRNLSKEEKGETPKWKKNVEDVNAKTPSLKRKNDGLYSVEDIFSPVSPELSETKKKKKKREDFREEKTVVMTRSKAKLRSGNVDDGGKMKKRVYYKKVAFDGGDFEVGDDVYVKRREDASSDDEDPEVEECRVCFKSGRSVMIECDDCLGGFHLKCLKPPLKQVPEGDWVCTFCEAKKLGKEIELPKPPEGKKRVRTMREKLLSSHLWAACIERLGEIFFFPLTDFCVVFLWIFIMICFIEEIICLFAVCGKKWMANIGAVCGGI